MVQNDGSAHTFPHPHMETSFVILKNKCADDGGGWREGEGRGLEGAYKVEDTILTSLSHDPTAMSGGCIGNRVMHLIIMGWLVEARD